MSRKSYPNVNAANQYARDVVRGKIVACQFVIQACQRHLDDLMAEKSKSFRYRFDKDLAERAAKFIQLLPHTKGEWAFKRMPITLEPWQLFVICCAFGWVNKGSRLRRFREVYTEIPRKNGKSAISAGVALYCFACDNEFGAEVYSGATTEKQAWEVFRPARLMCKRTPMLTEAFGIEVNDTGIKQNGDGILDIYANGVQVFRFQNDTLESKKSINVTGRLTPTDYGNFDSRYVQDIRLGSLQYAQVWNGPGFSDTSGYVITGVTNGNSDELIDGVHRRPIQKLIGNQWYNVVSI